jgi:hypothetical protein
MDVIGSTEIIYLSVSHREIEDQRASQARGHPIDRVLGVQLCHGSAVGLHFVGGLNPAFTTPAP